MKQNSPAKSYSRRGLTDWSPGGGVPGVSRRPGVTTPATPELAEVPGGVQARLGIAWSGPLAWLVRAAYGGLTRRYVESEAAAIVARCHDLSSRDQTSQSTG